MRFDLNAVCLKAKAEPNRRWSFDDAFAKCFPIKVRPSTQVGVVIANSTIHLGKNGYLGNALTRSAQTHHDVCNLFAYGGGTSGLAMGAAQHGYIGICMGHVTQFGDDGVEQGQHHLLATRL